MTTRSADQGIPPDAYRVPDGRSRSELMVVNSRFITTVVRVESVDEVKAALHELRHAMPDAHHHVYAFRVGHGNSVIEGLSDDGEPSGTSGPPVMAVLRGSGLGDVLVVVTRYFGGTKLGTGGLVRAYGDAARAGLQAAPTTLKISTILLGVATPYPLYEQVKRLTAAHDGIVEDQTFEADVLLVARFPAHQVEPFRGAVLELSAGRVEPVALD